MAPGFAREPKTRKGVSWSRRTKEGVNGPPRKEGEMRLIDKHGETVVQEDTWAALVLGAFYWLVFPRCSLGLAALWWVADVARMKHADVGTLDSWLTYPETYSGCPFDSVDGGQELEGGCRDDLFDVASEFWDSSVAWYTRIGMLRALRKAAKKPVKTTEELVRMWAAEMGLTVEE